MFTLLFGVLLVAGSAVGFGLALFGRRPIPQPAMSTLEAPRDVALAEPAPSSVSRRDATVAGGGASATLVEDDLEAPPDAEQSAGWARRLLRRDATAAHVDASDVELSTFVRVRSALLLAITVAGLAAIIGILSSIVIVGLGLLVT